MCSLKWLLLLVIFSLVLIGCGDDGGPEEVTSEPVDVQDISTPDSQLPQSETRESDPVATESIPTLASSRIAEVLDIPSLDANLGLLDEYRLEMRAQFFGEKSADDSLDWTITSQRSVTRDPAAVRLDASVQGFAGQDDFSEISLVRIGEESYLVIPSVGCISRSGDDGEVGQIMTLPNDLVAGLSGARLESPLKIVNGTPSHYYLFNQDARPEWQDEGLALTGHLYVAEDGGTVTRIELTASGTGTFHPQRDPESGIFTLEIDVTELDSSAPVQVPESCEIPAEYPVTDDAYQITVIDDLVSYRTQLPPADVLAFFEEQMLERGWIAGEEAILLDDSAFLVYEKDGNGLTVSLDIDSAEEAVVVLISP
ncbi:MAG: hypothetical protein WA996_25860 [Candidatus Promineifilaceae bacterium]